VKKPGSEQYSQKITIRVSGHIDNRYNDDFGSLQVTELTSGETLITGEIEDQAQLFGLLLRFRDLGIPLLEVNCCISKTNSKENNDEY
jgi:hypothetical protein